MKKLSLLLSAFLLTSFGLFAQKELTSGYVKMEITKVEAEDEQMATMLQMMKGSESEYYFNSDYMLAKVNAMGGMFTTDALTDLKTKSVTSLVNAMGQKMAVTNTEESKEKAKAPEVEVEYVDNDTKEILGYKTSKAIITTPSQPGMKFTVYLTKEIKANSSMINMMESIEMDGFPLEYIIEANGMKLTMEAQEIKDEIDPAVFELSMEGYKKMTPEEFKKAMGAMGGGMGF